MDSRITAKQREHRQTNFPPEKISSILSESTFWRTRSGTSNLVAFFSELSSKPNLRWRVVLLNSWSPWQVIGLMLTPNKLNLHFRSLSSEFDGNEMEISKQESTSTPILSAVTLYVALKKKLHFNTFPNSFYLDHYYKFKNKSRKT